MRRTLGHASSQNYSWGTSKVVSLVSRAGKRRHRSRRYMYIRILLYETGGYGPSKCLEKDGVSLGAVQMVQEAKKPQVKSQHV